MFVKVIKGDITSADEMVIRVEDVLVLDVHSTGYTEYSMIEDDRVIDYLLDNPKLEKCMMAQIHSHHNMSVFFSGTDTDELLSNADKYPFYVSLIVNNDGDVCAKIGSYAEEIKTTYSTKVMNKKGKYITKTFHKTQKAVIVYDCEIEFEKDLKIENQLDVCVAIKRKRAEELEKNKTSLFSNSNWANTGNGFKWNNQIPDTKKAAKTTYTKAADLIKIVCDEDINSYLVEAMRNTEDLYKNNFYDYDKAEESKEIYSTLLYNLSAVMDNDLDSFTIIATEEATEILTKAIGILEEYKVSYPNLYEVMAKPFASTLEDYKLMIGEM